MPLSAGVGRTGAVSSVKLDLVSLSENYKRQFGWRSWPTILEALPSLAGRYDFHMGRKLAGHLERSGLTVRKVLTLEDQEHSFTGRAQQEVVDAWRTRFDRMKLLRDLCGSDFEQVRDEFLQCLMSADHWSQAKVYCCIATK